MPGPDLSYALGLTPVEAVRYFRSKGIAVTENWHDLWQEAQARAFTVTGITKLDLMQDIRGAVDAAMAYSLRRASTGSLRLAALEGMRPARNVRNTLMAIRMTAACHGSEATFATSNSE